MAKDDPILTTMRFIPQHEVVQKYGAILPGYLTNQAMKESEAYKTYYNLATGKVTPKLKYVRRSTRTKTDQAPQDALALSEAEPMKIAIKRSKTQLHSSHTSGSGAHEGTGVTPGVPNVPTYHSDDEQISWKSSDKDDDDKVNISKDDDDNANDDDKDDQDDDDERTKSDNDGDDFVHPKFFTHDTGERHDEEEENEEDSFDLMVQTSSYVDITDDEDYDYITQGGNEDEEKLDEEKTNKEVEVNELYRDVNVNLEGRDTVMTDAPQINVQATQVTEDTHVIITAVTPEVQQQSSLVSSSFISNMLNPNPDTGIDSILNLNVESTSLVDVHVTTNVEIPPSSATTLPPPPLPLILPLQQTPVPTTITIGPSASLQNLPNFGSLFKFEDRVQALEKDFSKFKQTNQFAEVVSLIPGIVDTYLANKMHEAVKAVVQLQSTEDSQQSIILDTYGDTVTFKRRRDDEDDDDEPFAGSNRGSKGWRAGKEPKSTSALKEKTSKLTGSSKEGSKSKTRSIGKSAQAVEQVYTVTDLEEPKPTKPLTPDHDWNKTLPVVHGPIQPWISTLSRNEDPRKLFNELMDTPLDFSTFMLNRLKVDTLIPDLLAGLTFELMKGLCKSLVELEYFFKEVYKAITNQLDWNNPEGQQYLHDIRKPLPLIPNSQVTKTKTADYGHIKWIEDLVPNTMWINRESARDVYSRHRIIAITKLTIVEWHNYKHLDWITVRRDDDKLYTFKEAASSSSRQAEKSHY
ncbi:hypothetical protein Tco_0759305 [Tanacetum coccineum]